MVVYDPTTDTRQLLKKILEVSDENHKMLKKMERHNRWAIALRAFYWIIILGTALGTYYFVQPYLGVLKSSLGVISNNIGQLESLVEKLPQ